MDYNSISVCDELHSGIYILQRNDHIGTNVFKIGRTDVGIFNRYSSGYDTVVNYIIIVQLKILKALNRLY